MKKFLPVGLLALIFLSGCGQSTVNGLISNQVKQAAEQAAQQAQNGNTNQNQDHNAGSGNDINTCLSGCDLLTNNNNSIISKDFCVGSCWSDKAKTDNDITICDTKINKDDATLQFACRSPIALASDKPEYCNGIGKDNADIYRASCISDIAKKRKDITLCDTIDKASISYSICQDEVNGK